MRDPIPRYAPSSAGVRPGDLVAGKYRVERLLGRGGMGLVVAATHVHLGEQVALKLLLPGSPLTPAALARFLREGRAAARMRGENVARVRDAGVLDSGEPYLVLEYLEGIDLRALLRRRGPVPVDAAVSYVLQACEALAEAHSLGIVHRDLKPANLFLARRADGSPVVKVIDFGISKIDPGACPEGPGATLTGDGAAVGTPHYMAPEQMRSARGAGPPADIWSLGAVLFTLVTGSPPFAGETLVEVYDGIVRGGAPSLRAARGDAPPELEEIVQRCLRIEPAERYQDVGALAAALARVLAPDGHPSAERAIRLVRGKGPSGAAEDEGAPDGLVPPLAETAPEEARALPAAAGTEATCTLPAAAGTEATCDRRPPTAKGTWGPSVDGPASVPRSLEAGATESGRRPFEPAAPPGRGAGLGGPRLRKGRAALLAAAGVLLVAGGLTIRRAPPWKAPRALPAAAEHDAAVGLSAVPGPAPSAAARIVPVPTARALPDLPASAETSPARAAGRAPARTEPRKGAPRGAAAVPPVAAPPAAVRSMPDLSETPD